MYLYESCNNLIAKLLSTIVYNLLFKKNVGTSANNLLAINYNILHLKTFSTWLYVKPLPLMKYSSENM